MIRVRRLAISSLPIFAGVILLALSPAFAQQPQPQPGMWKVTTKMNIPGMPANMPGRENTHTSCMTPDMVKDPKSFAGNPQGQAAGENCKYTHAFKGGQLTWQVACTGAAPVTAEGTMTFESPQRYRGTVNTATTVQGQAMKIAMTIEGQRIGDCPR
jgi:hypothetical protein